VCHLIVDSTLKEKTGQPHPLAKKGRLNEYSPYIFGLHIVIVMLHWGNYRIPVDFIGMEACGSAHYWARRFGEHNHEVRLIAPQLIKAYVKSPKHDALMLKPFVKR
jgi:hypothetical protein